MKISKELSRIISSYDSARRLMENIRNAHVPNSGVFPFDAQSVEELSLAVAQGRVGFGDLVEGKGWLSMYASWYLPSAYSPYHLSIQPIVEGKRWVVRTAPHAALLPAGQLPFASSDRSVGFLYPKQTQGFSSELSPDEGESRYASKVQLESVEDNPWIFSLDDGSGSCHPTGWTVTTGDLALASEFFQDETQNLPNPKIYSDPSLVRRAAQVPPESQPIPIIFPPSYDKYIHTDIKFRARLSPLDSEVMEYLLKLGQPLTEKAFAHFVGGRDTPIKPFCLRVESDNCEMTLADETDKIGYPKIGTLLVEWFFEDPATGLPVQFGDEELLSWFLPCAKNHAMAFGNQYLPSRWTGKLYGFNGPLYFFQTGPIGFTMSPEGLFSASQETYFEDKFSKDYPNWKNTVTRMQRELVDRFQDLHGKALRVRVTYLTDLNWMSTFGNVLEGRGLWAEATKTLHTEQRARLLMNQFEKQKNVEEERKKMRPIKVLFVSSNPTDTAPIQIEQEIRDIKQRIKLAKLRDLLLVEQVSAARPEDLLQAFNEHEVDIFHFSGHGSSSGELGLCAPNGTFHPLKSDVLSDLMRILGKKVQVAVLNACYSIVQAQAIQKYVPCAIGMNDSVGDEAAIVFSSAFYGALAFGQDVQNAFDQGVLAIKMANLPGDAIPELMVKDGVDASEIRPVKELFAGT